MGPDTTRVGKAKVMESDYKLKEKGYDALIMDVMRVLAKRHGTALEFRKLFEYKDGKWTTTALGAQFRRALPAVVEGARAEDGMTRKIEQSIVAAGQRSKE